MVLAGQYTSRPQSERNVRGENTQIIAALTTRILRNQSAIADQRNNTPIVCYAGVHPSPIKINGSYTPKKVSTQFFVDKSG